MDGREVAFLRATASPPWQTLLLGEAPSRISDPHQPLLGGRSGLLLARLAGLEPYRFGFLLRCINLLPTMPGEADKRRRLRAAGARLRPALENRRAIVLGRHVADGLGVDAPFLEWRSEGLLDYVILPHPSGRAGRLWTSDMRAAVAGLLRAECARAAAGARLDLPPDARLGWLDELAVESS